MFVVARPAEEGLMLPAGFLQRVRGSGEAKGPAKGSAKGSAKGWGARNAVPMQFAARGCLPTHSQAAVFVEKAA